MHLTKNLIIYCLALFFLFFQEPKLKAAASSPLPINLSLKQVIEETLKNNTSIAVQKYNSKINEQAILERKADFDAVLDFGVSVREETRQAAGAFANPTKSRNQNYDWDFSVSQKFLTGANYELGFNTNRNLTNSTFAGLNPQYTSDINFTMTLSLIHI